MICRLLKNIIIAVMVTVGLTACIQDGGMSSDPALGASGSAINGGKFGYSHTNYHDNNGRNSSSGVILNPSIIEPPASYSQLMGTGGSLWDRLRTNFQLPPATNRPQVQAQINWYMHNQNYLDHIIRRAAPYMYLIFQETQSRNLPAELVLLPIMESAYNPFIRSSRGAVGLWQLMSGTASGFGVKQDFWYDGRRDVYASTNAALDYLTYLQSYFGGDWLLAIAAYDAGEGRLQSAVHHNAERGLSTDFWSLSLPVETQAYVPRLLALAAIIQNPGKYNIALPPITDQPYLQQVDLGAPINLTQAADMAGMSLAELKALNPGYSRTSTGPNGPYRLLLPIDRIPMFKERLAAMPALTKTTWGRYKIQRGDTLNSIADRFDSSVAELRNVNHLKGNHVPVGRVIMIPMGREQVTPHIYDLATGQKTPLTAENVVDQAANVAASQAPVTTAVTENTTAVAAATTPTSNNTVAQSAVSDETIDEAATTTAEQSTTTRNSETKLYHVIKHGETLSTIARHYDVTVNDLTRWNKLKSGKVLKPGSRLIIYRAAAGNNESAQEEHSALHRSAPAESANNSALNSYTVRSGDTLMKIAREQGVSIEELKRINRLKSNALRNGQMLRVPHAADNELHSEAKVIRYTVHAGDNLIKIANHYNVKVASLRKWNHLAEGAVVKPGQKLVIYTEG